MIYEKRNNGLLDLFQVTLKNVIYSISYDINLEEWKGFLLIKKRVKILNFPVGLLRGQSFGVSKGKRAEPSPLELDGGSYPARRNIIDSAL
jgi:hypothetical protein